MVVGAGVFRAGVVVVVGRVNLKDTAPVTDFVFVHTVLKSLHNPLAMLYAML